MSLLARLSLLALVLLLGNSARAAAWEGHGSFTKKSEGEVEGVKLSVLVTVDFKLVNGVCSGDVEYRYITDITSTKSRMVDCYQKKKGAGALAGGTRSKVEQTTFESTISEQSCTLKDVPVAFVVRLQENDNYAVELDIPILDTTTTITQIKEVSGGCKPVPPVNKKVSIPSKTNPMSFGGLVPSTKVRYEGGVRAVSGTYTGRDFTLTYDCVAITQDCDQLQAQLDAAKAARDALLDQLRTNDNGWIAAREGATGALANDPVGGLVQQVDRTGHENVLPQTEADGYLAAYAKLVASMNQMMSMFSPTYPEGILYKQKFQQATALFPQVVSANTKVKELERQLEACLAQTE